MKKTLFMIIGILLLSGGIVAQNPVPEGNNAEKDRPFTFYEKLPNTNEPRPEDIRFVTLLAGSKTVKNAPYTANATTESTQTLGDGNRIVNKTTASVARDSEGRTRREEEAVDVGGLQASGRKIATINDPVANAQYVFVPGDLSDSAAPTQRSGEGEGVGVGSGRRFSRELPQKVRVFNLSKNAITNKVQYATNNERGTNTYFTVEDKPENEGVKHESLGSQVIEGVNAEGTRETRTIPAGAIGNEKPIVITMETWTSPDLQEVVLSKRNDPRFGDTVYRLTDINRGEPDPSLFQPPSNLKKATPTK